MLGIIMKYKVTKRQYIVYSLNISSEEFLIQI